MHRERLGWKLALFAAVTLAAMMLCVCLGSVRVPLGETLSLLGQGLRSALARGPLPAGARAAISLKVL